MMTWFSIVAVTSLISALVVESDISPCLVMVLLLLLLVVLLLLLLVLLL